MRMQYKVCAATSFKYYISVYHDGEYSGSYEVWLDKLDEELNKLENQGYIRGFSKKEVENAYRQYELMKENII